IQIFLAKANFGQKTYSVIGQGMVENFLNTSPSERKAFFDEATGVKQYQIKRDISLNKLENSQENLAKVEMLLNEINPRLKSLTRQVGKLKKRQSLEEELLIKQLNYYSCLWQEVGNRSEKFQKEINKLQIEKDVLEKKIEVDKNNLEQLSQGETIGKEFYELQKNFLSLQAEKEKIEKQQERLALWITLNKKNKNSDNEMITTLISDREELQKIIAVSSKEIEKLKEGSLEIEKLKEIEDSIITLERELSDKNRELSKIEAWIEVKLEKQGKFDLSFLVNRQSSLKFDQVNLKEDLSELDLNIGSSQEKINKNKEISQEIEKNILEVEKELGRINNEEHPSNIKKINQDLKILSQKIETISDFRDSENIGRIIKEIKDSIKELLNFSSGNNYNYKIEKINNKLIDFRKEKNKIDQEIYNLQIKYNSDKNKKEVIEKELFKIEKEITEIEVKIKNNKEDGDKVSVVAQKKALEAVISDLSKKIIKAKEEKNILRLQIDNSREGKSRQQEVLQDSQNKLNEINNKINLFKNDSLKIQSKIEDLWEEIRSQSFLGANKIENEKNIEEENSLINEILLKIEKELPVLQEKINNFNQAQEDKKRSLLDLQKSINDNENILNQIINELNNNKIELTREETRTEDLINNILEDKIDLEKVKGHKVNEDVQVDLFKQEIGQIKSQLELIGGIDPETEKEYEETKKRYDFLSEQTEDLDNTIKSLEKVITELDSVIKDRFEVEFKIISEKFNEYFKILFNGGNAKIFPIYDNINGEEEKNEISNENGEKKLESQGFQSSKNIKLIRHLKKHNALGFSGVDISATPPGKKIASVNMLSGGERALTDIALICAIISANP
ncbi:MAG: hypothetical protein PHP37_04635, partial [Patescibacteria group bacterium]|nr:hypothetical protein [Patescibacteria group bacterium]